jgi:hypothetical protein
MEQQEITQLWNELRGCSALEVRSAFAQYVKSVLTALETEVISDERAALLIARAMFLSPVESDPDCEAVTQYAGELEVPRSRNDVLLGWRRISEIVAGIS